ncbi:MAG TPA: hypothetical protein VM619_14780 [Luteimonas sp.]|nr:hypothetical protein [Luteimonas sp.]
MIRFVLVAHHTRRGAAEALARALDAHLCMDEENHGATWNHRRALEWAREQRERVIVLEDDALPVPGFVERASAVLDRWPDDLVSLYLGTGRPQRFQAQIGEVLQGNPDHIRLPALIHAVCYSIPPAGLQRVIGLPLTHQTDFAIGDNWGRPVVYCVPSLVDHTDGEPVERHADGEARSEARRAWRLG